uniref:Uncharacterized protein n=2 Tax=Oryza TaxID=4527 RepID=A0A0D3H3U6_9ORYZ
MTIHAPTTPRPTPVFTDRSRNLDDVVALGYPDLGAPAWIWKQAPRRRRAPAVLCPRPPPASLPPSPPRARPTPFPPALADLLHPSRRDAAPPTSWGARFSATGPRRPATPSPSSTWWPPPWLPNGGRWWRWRSRPPAR